MAQSYEGAGEQALGHGRGEESYRTIIHKAILSPRVVFDMESLNFLSMNKKEYPLIKDEIQKCESKFRNNLLTCLALAGALAFSLRRYFPSMYSKMSLKPFVIDLFMAVTGLTLGSRYASNTVQIQMNKLISSLIFQGDIKTLAFLKQFSQKFHISDKHISKLISASDTEYKSLAQLIENAKIPQPKAGHIY